MTGPFLQIAGAVEPVNVTAVLLETNYVGSSPNIDSFFDVFHTHKQSNCAVTLLLYNYKFQKDIFAPIAGLEMRVTQIFVIFA